MKRLKYLSFIFAVNCETRDDSTINCIETIKAAEKFGDLEYDKLKLETCQAILQKNNEFSTSSCKLKGTTKSHLRTVDEIQCKKDDDTKCPASPTTGCIRNDETPTASDKFCIYTCTEQTLACPDTPLKNTAFVDGTYAYCFNKDVSDCEHKYDDENLTNQLEYSCAKRPCGYLSSSDGFTAELTFDEIEFVNRYAAVDSQDTDFGCQNKPMTAGCTCSSDDIFDKTAILKCPATAYTNKCNDNNKCVDNQCFKGKPILDYEYNKCTFTNEGLEYCRRDEKAMFPCGQDFENQCEPGTKGYDCTCVGADDETCPENGSWDTDDNECVIKEFPVEEKMMDCEMTCFDEDFTVEVCPDDSIIFWQCYDDFTKISTTNPDNSHIKTEKIKGTYEDIELCSERKCPEGNCICKDTVSDEAKSYCSAVGEFYVSEHDLDHDDHDHKRSDEEITEPTSIVYQCMFFMDDYAAINNINDVDSKSNCSELTPPNNEENAICPVGQGGCHTMKESGNSTFTAYGFFKCMCEKECSYGCGKSSYDAVFEDDFDATKDPYVTYTCEKDNLVMIICTSIFVPLGVAGIAAGVYFFFFHESSEVAPVETDNELATTQSSEDKQVEEDKEETKSEIQNDN